MEATYQIYKTYIKEKAIGDWWGEQKKNPNILGLAQVIYLSTSLYLPLSTSPTAYSSLSPSNS